MKKINFSSKFDKFSDHWSPKVIAEMNDYQFKLVKIKDDFIWHMHEDTDEVFIVVDGEIAIEFEKETINLKTGEMLVVPKGIKHRQYAKKEDSRMLVEQKGVLKTGDKMEEINKANED